MVMLICHYHSTSTFKNKKTSSDLKARGYTDEMIASLGQGSTASRLEIDTCGFRITGDIMSMFYDQFEYVLTLHEAYNKGHLPFDGSFGDQPSQIVELFNLLTYLQIETHQRQQKEQQKKQSRQR